MISCKDLVRIKSSDVKVGPLKRLEISMHLMMCTHCARYAKQLKKIGSQVRQLFSESSAAKSSEVEALKRDVLSKLKERT